MKTLAIFALFCFAALFFSTQSLFAQGSTPKPFVEQSDPEAKKIVAQLRDKYKAVKSTQVDYTLTIENGENKEVQKGKIFQKDRKFRVANNSNEMVCDGKTIWMYMKKQNEVQITDFDPNDEDLLSPNKILNFDQVDKNFLYAITNEDATSVSIEFKPTNKNSEYSKMRVKVNKAKNEVEQIKVFTKDGTRYTLDIHKMQAASIDDSQFIFNKAQYPGVRETDLRD